MFKSNTSNLSQFGANPSERKWVYREPLGKAKVDYDLKLMILIFHAQAFDQNYRIESLLGCS